MKKNNLKTFIHKGISLVLIAFMIFSTLPQINVFASSKQIELAKTIAWVRTPGSDFVKVYSSDNSADVQTLNESISQSSTLKIRYDFKAPTDLSGHTAGNTASFPTSTINLPDEYDISLLKTQENNTHPDKVNNYFTYSFKEDTSRNPKKYIEITFTDKFFEENAAGTDCFIEHEVAFDLSGLQNSVETDVTVEYNPVKTFHVRFLPKGEKPKLRKSGVFYSTENPTLFGNVKEAINPHEIKWNIIINENLEVIPRNQAIVRDTFNPEQILLRPGSVKVYEHNVNLNGDSTETSTLVSNVEYTVSEDPNGDKSAFTVSFNQEIKKAYRIEYITDIKPNLKDTAIRNTASFPDGSTNVARDTLKVKHQGTDKVTKSAVYRVKYDGTGNQSWLRWTIIANRSQRNLIQIKDILPNGLELIQYGRDPYNDTTPETTNLYEKFFVRKIKPEALAKSVYSESDYITLSAGELQAAYDINYQNKTFTLTPKPNTTSNDALVIVYDTKYTDPQHIGTNLTNDAAVTVTPGLSIVESNGTRGVFTASKQTGVLSGEISKRVDEHSFRSEKKPHIDHKDQRVRWRIYIDPKAGSMNNLTYTDSFPYGGLTLVPYGDLHIKDGVTKNNITDEIVVLRRETVLVKGTDYNLTVNPNKDGYNITFIKPVQHETSVLYYTKYNRNTHIHKDQTDPVTLIGNSDRWSDLTSVDQRDVYRNQITANWSDTKGGKQHTNIKKNHGFRAHVFVKDNGGKIASPIEVTENGKIVKKMIDPATRQMEWVIYTNFNQENVGLDVADTIGDGHKLVADSLEVREYSITNSITGQPQSVKEMRDADTSVLPQTDYTYTPNPNLKGFTLVKKSADTKRYAIIYRTVLDDSASVNKYKNEAVLNGRTIKAELSFPDFNTFLTKSGVQRSQGAAKTPFIDWTVDFNKSLSAINNFILKDTLSEDQEYDYDSFKLYHYPFGDTDIVSPTLYQLNFLPYNEQDNTFSFELTFKAEPVRNYYRLKYSTLYTRTQGQLVPTNNAEMSGDTVPNSTKKSVRATFATATSNAGSQSMLRSIEITKKFSVDNSPIAGILFQLYRNGQLYRSFPVTSQEGKTKLEKLPRGTYTLKEIITNPANHKYEPLADQVVQLNDNLKLEVLNMPKNVTPLLPYIPSPNTPAEDPKKEEPKTETPDKPNPETPDTPNVPNTDVPKENNPDSETPKTPNPETPSQPSPEPETPTIDGEIDIPENVIPLRGKDPKNGIVVLDGNKWKYTPNKGFYGKDSFTVILRTPDGEETEEIIEVDVPVPLGHTTLPQTDGIPPFVFFFAGSLVFFGAYFFKKRA